MSSAPMDPCPSDEDLARRAQQGCVASFKELVRRFQVPLLHFLRQRTAAEEAEDLVQDTFVRAYQNLHRYRAEWRFATWIFTIARRLSINCQRRKRPATDSAALENMAAATPAPPDALAAAESRRRLWDAAAEVLNEQQFAATWLYYVEEMSVQEVGQVLGRSRLAVKAILFRARKALMPVLREMESDSAARNHSRPIRTTGPSEVAEVANGC